MATVVQEREHLQAVSNGRVRERLRRCDHDAGGADCLAVGAFGGVAARPRIPGAHGLKQSWKNGLFGSGLPEMGRTCMVPRSAVHYAV